MSKKQPTNAEIDAWREDEDRLTGQIIRRHGVFIQSISGEPMLRMTCFAYTVGLFGMGHPELLVLGICGETAGRLLNSVAARVRAGADLVSGQTLEFDDWSRRVTVEMVPNPAHILFAANSFYQRPDEFSVPAFQLTYDDEQGRFPWDDGYAIPAWIQPRPGGVSRVTRLRSATQSYTDRMVDVAARDLRNNTAAVLRRVQDGEDVTITVHGQPVAKVVPIAHEQRWLTAREFIGHLSEFQADSKLREELAALIDETTDDLADPWEQ